MCTLECGLCVTLTWRRTTLQSWSLLYILGRLLAKGVPTIVFYSMARQRVYVFHAASAKTAITVKCFHP